MMRTNFFRTSLYYLFGLSLRMLVVRYVCRDRRLYLSTVALLSMNSNNEVCYAFFSTNQPQTQTFRFGASN